MKPLSPELETLHLALLPEADLCLVLVFGSVASGLSRPASDIDVAVLAKQPLLATQKIRLIEVIANSTGRAVDLIDLKTAGQPLLGEILRHGLRLIGSADAQADLATRAALDAQDFLPYVQRMLTHRRLAWTQ